MRKIFYFFPSIIIAFNLSAQTPGGLPNSVLWLRADVGASPSAWTDQSPAVNNFSQGATLNQPPLNTNVFNFNPALGFDGTNTFMSQPTPTGFPAGNADRSIFIVANATNTAGYREVFVYGSPFTGTNVTCQMGTHNGDLINAYFASPDDLAYANYWDNAANLNGALASFTLNSNVQTQYNRGVAINSSTIVSTLTATSVDGLIGALRSDLLEVWQGNIAEVIMFSTALTDAERNRVESYLALKYGFTLGNTTAPISYIASDGLTTYWTGSTTWQNDVFGIGTDAGTGFQQTQSNSINTGSGAGTGQYAKGNLVLTAAPFTDGQFLMIGNDAGALSEQLITAGQAPATAVGSQRLLRNWKVQNTGVTGTVNLSFDTVGLTLTGQVPGDFRLMIDSDGDGDYTTGTTFVTPVSFTGTIINFTGVSLGNNSEFTLITQATALLPATWQSFTVTAEKNIASLVWKTSDEVNVDHYTAEYSTDGIAYKAVGTVAAKNSPGTNTYSLVQANLPVGTRYYRVKRVDKDGRFELSAVKSIKVVGINTVSLRTNPVTTGKLELTIDLQQSQQTIIRIINTDGKVLVQQYSSLSAGTNTVSTNIAGIAKGAYFLQVQLGSQVFNKKFVRM